MSPRIIAPRERKRLAADLRRAYEQGASIRALAKTCGRSYGFVTQLLKEAGTTMRPRGGSRDTPIDPRPRPGNPGQVETARGGQKRSGQGRAPGAVPTAAPTEKIGGTHEHIHPAPGG